MIKILKVFSRLLLFQNKTSIIKLWRNKCLTQMISCDDVIAQKGFTDGMHVDSVLIYDLKLLDL